MKSHFHLKLIIDHYFLRSFACKNTDDIFGNIDRDVDDRAALGSKVSLLTFSRDIIFSCWRFPTSDFLVLRTPTQSTPLPRSIDMGRGQQNIELDSLI